MHEHNRDGRGARLGRQRRGRAKRSDHRDLLTYQIGHERRQPVVLTFCPAIFDCEALAFNIAAFFETLPKRSHEPVGCDK